MTDEQKNINQEEIKNDEKIEENTKQTKEEKTKKSFFGKECKNCEKYKKENEENKAGWLRALADYKNLQNEINTRRSEWAQMSETQILEEFIPVYENFKLAFRLQTSGFSAEQQKWADGIGYIMKQFESVLKSHGVEEIKTVGEKFDPKFHEAIKEEEQDGVESHIILKEVDGGYKVGDKIIKPAKVIINK